MTTTNNFDPPTGSPATLAAPGEATSESTRQFGEALLVSGAVDNDAETVGGVQGAIGIAMIVALFIWLGTVNIWYLVFAVGLLISIFLHETGHFVTARWTGMKATQFFIGFGPRLWSFRRGETEYGVRALPLGAFVSIVGMNRDEIVAPADENRTYRIKSFPRRLLVISAGSIMHMLIAIVLLFTVYAVDGEPKTAPGAEVAQPSAVVPDTVSGGALAAGVQPGDVIVAVDGVAVDAVDDLGPAVRSHAAGDTIELTVLRGGPTVDGGATVLDIPVTLGSSFGPGDQIVSVNGVETPDAAALAVAVSNFTPDDIVDVGLVAPGSDVTTHRSAKVEANTDGTLSLVPTPLAGVSTMPNGYTEHHSVGGAAVNAVTDIFPTAWDMSKGVVKVLNPVNVFTHLNGTNTDLETRPTTVVGVGAVSADVGAALGIIGVLYLLAALNVFVGVFNMFPLLPLDGGHAAIAVYERVRELLRGGRQRYYADVAKLIPLTIAVVLLLGAIFMAGLYLDITQPL